MKPTLYIDIETIAGPESGKDAIEVSAPATYKKPESIQKWMDENAETAREDIYRKQSFNGGYGQICQISWAFNDGDVEGLSLGADRANEGPMLEKFVEQMAAELSFGDMPEPCGHYISGFDLRFIKHRCIIHGIKVPVWLARDPKPWEIRDTMIMWAGIKDRVSLDELCKILGIDGKGDMDGSMVYDAWIAGEHDKISEYCADDVEKVRKINKKFMEAGI